MRILGIDPGSIVCGYGVIDSAGSKLSVVEYGVIQLKKHHEELPLRLKEIFVRIDKLIGRTKPECAAFETMFYAKNVQSLIKLSHARAVAVLSAVMHDLPIFEYTPREVKKSVVGHGTASKEQVQYMMKAMLKIEETPEFFDVTDALAVAVCHSLKSKLPSSKSRNWSDFLKNNPERIAKIK